MLRAASAGSPRATIRRPRGRSSASGLLPLLAATRGSRAGRAADRAAGAAVRRARADAGDGRLAGPAERAGGLLRRGSRRGRGARRGAAAGARVGGHPLGRRGLARPDRVPLAVASGTGDAAVPRARRSARAAPGLERRAPDGRDDASSNRSPPTTRRRLVESLLADAGAQASTAGRARRTLRRQPAVRRGDGAADRSRTATPPPPSCPTRSRACSPLGSTRSQPDERQLVADAAVLGRTFSEAALEPLLGDTARAARAAPSRRCSSAASSCRARAPTGGERRARLQARADPRRRLRDAPEGRTGAAARAGRRVHPRRPRGRARGRDGRDRRALRARGRLRGGGPPARAGAGASCAGSALRYGEAAGDAAASLYSNPEALGHYAAATELAGADEETAQRIAREERRHRPAPRARRAGDRRVGGLPRVPGGSRPTTCTWPSSTARSARPSRTRATASARSSTTSRAST